MTNGGNHWVIQATCALHPGPVGYVNLVVSEFGGEITLDPHAVGACVLTLDEVGAHTLREALTEWLGYVEGKPATSAAGHNRATR